MFERGHQITMGFGSSLVEHGCRRDENSHAESMRASTPLMVCPISVLAGHKMLLVSSLAKLRKAESSPQIRVCCGFYKCWVHDTLLSEHLLYLRARRPL